MTERKFKVGDKVVFIHCIYKDDSREELIGKKGTVSFVSTNPNDALPYDVSFEGYTNGHWGTRKEKSTDNSHRFCNEKELELVVSSNSHYETAVQPIEFMQANMTPEEFVGFLKGNIIKYAGRCGRKDEPLKEAKKIKQYAGWLVEALEGKTINPRG